MKRNSMTVDLEEYFQVSNFQHLLPRTSWATLASRVEEPTRRLLDVLEATDTHATFFALGWVADRHPALLREISDRGHEIACHGYEHELVYEIGPERFRADLRRARVAIEDAVGVCVEGYRAPSYSITEDSLWALEILSEEGFRYDSSIFPIRHHRYGIPHFPRHPVQITLRGGHSIREFPMTTWQLGPLRLPLGGGAYLRFLPAALFRFGVGRLVASGEPTALYTHPWEVDFEQPRQAVGWKVRVNHYYNLERTEGRVRALLERFDFAPMARVLDDLAGADELPAYSFPTGEARPASPERSSRLLSSRPRGRSVR